MRILVLLIVLFTSVAYGQPPAPSESSFLFPQVVDGRDEDGSGFLSIIWVSNLSRQQADCTLFPYDGITADRFVFTSFTVLNGRWIPVATLVKPGLRVGYVRLTCTGMVRASLTYNFISPTDTTLGMTTVFASPSATEALLPVLTNGAWKYGIAMANDSDQTVDVTLVFEPVDQTPSITSVLRLLPRAQVGRFLHELLRRPINSSGTLRVTAQSGSFYIVGLIYDGPVFTTVVPNTR